MQPDKVIFTQLTIAELSAEISQTLLTLLLPLLPKPQTEGKHSQTIELYFTRKEVAKQLNISLRTLDKYTKAGKITAYRFAGRQKRYLQSDVLAWLDKIKTQN